MDRVPSLELLYRVQHRHDDGRWADMVEVREHHDAADHDPERGWGLRRLFRCEACPEEVTLDPQRTGPRDER